MQTFIYDFEGVHLGAQMYIRAKNQEDANEMFKAELPEYLRDANIKENGDLKHSVTINKIKPGRRVYLLTDGDY